MISVGAAMICVAATSGNPGAIATPDPTARPDDALSPNRDPSISGSPSPGDPAGVPTTTEPASPPPLRTIRVASIPQLQSAISKAAAGDRIELANGSYTTGAAITISRDGKPSAPIVIAAQRTGGVEIRGEAGFVFDKASYITVDGFRLFHSGEVLIAGDSHHIRLSRNVIQLAGGGNWVTVAGHDSQIDRNTFQNRTTKGVYLQVSGPGSRDMAQRTWIHHNYFFNHAFAGDNGGESIRLGLSSRSSASARAVVEFNLFERADGDPEAISVKSSDNLIRFNTLRNSKGMIVLRHGHRNRVEGNIVFGSGIRYHDNDHVIVNNLVHNGRVVVGAGTVRDDLIGMPVHASADRVLFAFNTVVGDGTLLEVDSGKTHAAQNCIFANNIFAGAGGAKVDGRAGARNQWQGNIFYGVGTQGVPANGFKAINPGLVTDAAGLLRIGSASSPAVNAAAGVYPTVTADFDLDSRSGAKDVGADEFGGNHRRPLTPADVGPGGQ